MIGRSEVALHWEDPLQHLVAVKLGAIVKGDGADLIPVLCNGIGCRPGGLICGTRRKFLDHAQVRWRSQSGCGPFATMPLCCIVPLG